MRSSPAQFRKSIQTLYSSNTSKSVYSNAFSWVDSKTTCGALPCFSASIHREIQRHHWSPAFNPGNCHSGLGVERSLPFALVYFKKFIRYDRAYHVGTDILFSGLAEPIAVKAGQRVCATGLQLASQYIFYTHFIDNFVPFKLR